MITPDTNAARSTFSQRQRWLYAASTFGIRLPGQVVAIALLYFYTDVQRLPPLWASTTLAIYAVYNALNNPVLGYIQDRFPIRGQRRIPWIRLGALPLIVFFALLWMPPVDGASQPAALVVYMFVVLVCYDAAFTAVSNAYYSLLPEMFDEYATRTDVAARINFFLTLAQLLGIALPLLIARHLGWPTMGIFFAVVSGATIFIGVSSMREMHPADSLNLSFRQALRATVLNRSFFTLTLAQTLRFVATQAQAAGIIFFIKYTIRIPESSASTVLGTVFIVSALMVYPWRQFIAVRFEPRTAALIAYLFAAVGAATLWFADSALLTHVAAGIIGLGFAGIFLMDNVLLADVVNEDEMRTGKRREAMYFGVNSMAGPLALSIVSLAFGYASTAFGYDPSLSTQPESVALGFRIFLTGIPVLSLLAAAGTIFFYPLHGEYLRKVQASSRARRAQRAANVRESRFEPL